jgi:CHRD domain-containing protein
MKKGMNVPTVLAALVATLLVALALATVANAGGRPLSAELTGAAEVPGPGDPNGQGQANLTLNQGQGTVCFSVEWQGIRGAVTAAHIHIGPAGVAGPVVVPLWTTPRASPEEGCVAADGDLIKDIRKNPQGYYVNLHTAEFPAGAVRGQLSK